MFLESADLTGMEKDRRIIMLVYEDVGFNWDIRRRNQVMEISLQKLRVEDLYSKETLFPSLISQGGSFAFCIDEK